MRQHGFAVDRSAGRRRAVADGNHHRHLAPAVIIASDDGELGQSGEIAQHPLQFGRIDVLAA